MKLQKAYKKYRLLQVMICNVIKRINIVSDSAMVYNREKFTNGGK